MKGVKRVAMTKVQGLFDVAHRAAGIQAGFGTHGFEAVTLADILAFALMLGSLAVAAAFTGVHVVAMHFVTGANGCTTAAIGHVGSESGGH